MSNFNQYLRSKGADMIVTRFFNGADLFTEEKITNLTWNIPEPEDKPASYYIEHQLTAVTVVKLEYTIDNGKEKYYSQFEVPREIDGAFIIEGAYRIATNTLNSNWWDCRINTTGKPPYCVNFDLQRKYDIPKKVLKVKVPDPLLGYSSGTTKEIALDDIDKFENRELLKLTEEQTKKLEIKLDLPYTPEYITKQLIEECIAFGDDRYKDLIIDKTIESVPTGFMRFLFKQGNYISIRQAINSYWTKKKILQEEINVLSNLCVRYFKGSSDTSKGSSDIQVSPGINAINLNSIGSKIQVGQSVAINTTMLDLIDVGDTPINQNVNKQNSLTVSTHITDDGVLFDVFDTNFTKITIKYLDYLNKKVCASEYVDYETNQIKPDSEGNVVAKYRMKRITIPASEVELIDLHPDYRLSATTRRIPFINYTDSVRVHMGTIPLVNAERPLVDTGNDEDLGDNILNEKFKHSSGKVREITEDAVVIELPSKEIVEIPRRTAIQSVNDVDVFTEPKVKVGQKVKEGDIITGAVGLEKDTYKSGLNALVLFHAMFGYVHEDAVVVSESFSKKMCNYSIIDLMFDVRASEGLKWIAPIGTQVKSKDKILSVYSSVRLDDLNRLMTEKLGGLFGGDLDLTEYTRENVLRVPNDIEEAWVSDVLVQEHKSRKRGSKTLNTTFSRTTTDKYLGEYGTDRVIIYNKFPEYIASDRLKPINLDDKDVKITYVIRIRLIKRTNLMVGSKLTNRYGGKGVISQILPDSQMPIMVGPDGKKTMVDIVMNPYSTVNRKIPSVLLESSLSNIAYRIHDLVDKYKETKTGKTKIMPMINKYYPGRYDRLDVEDFIKLHDKSRVEDVYYFNVGSYSTKFTPELVEKWSSELGVTSQSKILMPSKDLSDLDELKAELSAEEFEKVTKEMDGKYTEVDKPLMCGYMHIEELYHIPTYSNKVTSSLFGVDINERRDSPIMGKGKYRTTGQKIGEMELSAYLARSARSFISETRKDTAREDNQTFLNNLLGLGLTVSDGQGYNQGGSALKTKLNQMKVKFRLKNQK